MNGRAISEIFVIPIERNIVCGYHGARRLVLQIRFRHPLPHIRQRLGFIPVVVRGDLREDKGYFLRTAVKPHAPVLHHQRKRVFVILPRNFVAHVVFSLIPQNARDIQVGKRRDLRIEHCGNLIVIICARLIVFLLVQKPAAFVKITFHGFVVFDRRPGKPCFDARRTLCRVEEPYGDLFSVYVQFFE